MSPRYPQSFNRYAYVVNDPLNGNDPSGQDPQDLIDCMIAGDRDASISCSGGWIPRCSATRFYDDFFGLPNPLCVGPYYLAAIPPHLPESRRPAVVPSIGR